LASRSTLHRYTAFGLWIGSDLLMPELHQLVEGGSAPGLHGDRADKVIQIFEASHHDWPLLEESPHSTSTLAMATGDWRLELEGVGWFRAWDGNCVSWERWDDSVSDRDVRTFVVTSGLGALLIQRGALVLNATTLVRDGKGVLLLGSPVSGKSTLACCLLQQGWQLLSSELSVVDTQGMVWPGLQQLKLWHDSAVALGLDWQNLPLVRKGLKRYVLLPPLLPVADQPAPLAVIYGMGGRVEKPHPMEQALEDEMEPTPEEGVFRTLRLESERAALLRIRNQAYQPRYYRAMGQEANLFLKASSLVQQWGGYLLKVPEGIARMREAVRADDLLKPEALLGDVANQVVEVAS
jgi:hypothetical protein